ncbi:hypothetical protein NW754_002534 [Fusarium falciforme]|nr:hypothetical protein NW754_002534 [Fusarium falciforme]
MTVPTPPIVRFDATDPSTTIDKLVEVIKRDGGVIVEKLITPELAAQISKDLKPAFDTDIKDKYGFFPETTQRATGLLGLSEAWGDHKKTVSGKPIISSTAGFRVNPGGTQQVLHRDDNDYYRHNTDEPLMIGCVTALTKTTKENGATICIPGSHLWGPDRRPLDEEAVPAELEIGDALIFLGNLYHAGGANTTKNEYRETVGIFLCKPYLRPAENQFLMVPLEKVRKMKPQAQRLLGYGLLEPGVGFMNYQDPMRVLFGVEDEETVNM